MNSSFHSYGKADSIESGAVVLVLDLPAEDLSWLTLHPAGEWVGDQLRLGKRPLQWCYRPLTWPVWNHEHRRLVRFWSTSGGLDVSVIDALRSRRLDRVTFVEPSMDELAAQLREELASSASPPPSDARHLLGPRLAATPQWPRGITGGSPVAGSNGGV